MDCFHDRSPATVGPHHESVPCLAHSLGGDELRDHVEHPVDRYGKPDSLGAGPHGDVDPDDFAVDIEQRAAGIAWIDGSVCLDEIVIPLGPADLDVSVEG